MAGRQGTRSNRGNGSGGGGRASGKRREETGRGAGPSGKPGLVEYGKPAGRRGGAPVSKPEGKRSADRYDADKGGRQRAGAGAAGRTGGGGREDTRGGRKRGDAAPGGAAFGGNGGTGGRRGGAGAAHGRGADASRSAGRGGQGRPAAGGRAPEQPVLAALARGGRRKGEWLELRLPDQLAGVPVNQLLKQLPLPAKIAGKLMAAKGVDKQGKQLRLKLFREEQPEFPPDWMELNILYEDDFSLVVNKPAGYEVHPSVHGQRGTLAHGVASYYEMSGQRIRIRHIHRLDKETTGPVLYAKNELAHYVFDEAMRSKQIERIYIAVAEGRIAQDKGVIDLPIGQDRHHPTRRRVSETGEPALTRYEVLERFDNYTLVRLQLETGRTHQIRVHLSHIGHPLAGDGMYGGGRQMISRQALHGEKLVWHHPWTGERLTVRAPLPDDMNRMLQELRGVSP
ncbi:RluA family pseudouridine synthase [Paenibacillus turpanensis]|uniref:RluA family pseudouridine synthase n=1 Tax=Paenibacillus turpanensis TaxID=2689078 RepID=UPI00140A0D96|nr:RluA family pseudouridine synthase [Paenibacillus turpanensis]